MDAKITKERLSRMLSYDWLKVVGLILAAILVWSLIFTMTATRITPAQQFTVVNYFGNVNANSSKLIKVTGDAITEGVFSYEVIEMTSVDVPGSAEHGSTVLEARISTYEGDVIFVPNIEDGETTYEVETENGKETRFETYVERLVRTYGYGLDSLDRNDENGFFKRLERFLDRYYGEDGYKNGELNEELVRKDFMSRIEKNKDKRFKKSEEIEKGCKDELARIAKYREALIVFDKYVEEGLVEFVTTTAIDVYGDGSVLREGVYSINVCPDESKMEKLRDIVAYAKTVEGVDAPVLTAQNMNVAFFKFDEVEESFEFENLLYINYVIALSKTNA